MGRRCDVPDGRDFIAFAAELGSGNGADVSGFVGFVVFVFGPGLHDIVGRDERGGPIELGVRGRHARQPLQQNPAQQLGQLVGAGGVPDDVEPDLQHHLDDVVRQDREVDVGPQIAAPPGGTQRLQHRLQNRGRALLCQGSEFFVRTRALVERHLQSGAVGHRALRYRRAQIHDPVEAGPGGGVVELALGLLGDSIKVRVVAPEQLDEDRFLRLEMVIQAAREDSGRIGDFLKRGAQARAGDQRCSGLQYLGPPAAVVVGVSGIRRRHLRTPHNTCTAPDSRRGFA